MFKSFGNGYFALGLTIGGLSISFLFVWIISWFRNAAYQKECSYNQSDQNCEEVNNLTSLEFSDFIYITPNDSLAQWIMAIIAICATVISVWAVVLIRGTLSATQSAITVTREVGNDGSRAYIHVSPVTMYTGPPEVIVPVVNSGHTPARWFEIGAEVTAIQTEAEAHSRFDYSGVRFVKLATLAGKSSEDGAIKTDCCDHAVKSLLADKDFKFIRVDGIVRYETIFSEIYETEFSFYTDKASAEDNITDDSVLLKKTTAPVSSYRLVSKPT